MTETSNSNRSAKDVRKNFETQLEIVASVSLQCTHQRYA